MRTSSRNRRRSAILALCTLLLIISTPVSALSAEYTLSPEGTDYQAHIEVVKSDEYLFFYRGPLGERVPLVVSNISVVDGGGAIIEREESASQITFPEGNYTVIYTGQVRDSTLMGEFDDLYDVRVHLSDGFDVRNPLLGMISRGGTVGEDEEGLTVEWEQVRSFETRFYDHMREQALIIFGTFWITLCAVFILPYMLMRGMGR